MSHRVNFIIDDVNWAHLNAVPKGERSRLVNAALAEYRSLQKRRRAVREMDQLSQTLPSFEGTADEWVRADRDSHIG